MIAPLTIKTRLPPVISAIREKTGSRFDQSIGFLT